MKHILYTFVAEECKQEAKKFGLIQALDAVRQRIEKDQNLNKFELFEFPYLMRKKFSYQYRLLIKMVRREYQNKIYDIVVFLKIYHRGDKSYNSLYINSRPQFDAIYQQRDVEPALDEFVKNLSPQHFEATQLSSDLLPLLSEYRVDSLNLSAIAPEFYYESTQWQYAIAPKLSPTQLKNYYQTLFYAIERAEIGELQLEQDTDYYPVLHDIHGPKEKFHPFIYPKKIAYNMQRKPYYLGVEHEQQNELSLNYPAISQYQRKIPLEFALDEQLWTLSQQHHLPFELNEFQQYCLKELCFNYSPYPFVINASANSGKTTLLALLYVHFLFKKNPKQSLPCLLLCQKHEVESLRQQIKHYVQLCLSKQPELKLAYNTQQLDKLLQQSCLSTHEYLRSALNEQQQKEFSIQNFVDEHRFYQLFHKQFNPEKNPDYDCAQLAWYVIQYIIKEQNIFDDNLASVQHQPISETTFQFIYEKIWKAWYTNLAKQSLWDEQDLISYIDEHELALPFYSVLLADNSQRFSANFLDLLLNHNMWLKLGMADHLHNIPLIFMETHEFCDGIYKWQPALLNAFKKLIMVNNFDYFEPEQAHNPLPDIEITHLNDLAFHLYGAIPSLLETYHHHLSLSSRDLQKITTNDLGNPIEIVIVSSESAEFIPLLQQHHVPIIVNDAYYPLETVLQEKSAFQDLCNISSYREVPLVHQYSHLPTKQDAVILAGFDLEVISYINQTRQETDELKHTQPYLAEKLAKYELANLHKLDEQQRYRLNGQLHVLSTALNQGLSRIYIMSNLPFDTWQQFFKYPTIQVRKIDTHDVQNFIAVHTLPKPEPFYIFEDYLHQLLKKSNLNDAEEFYSFTHALYYQHQFDIEQRLKYEAIFYFNNHELDTYWKKYASYTHSYYIFHVQWIMEAFKAFLSYKHYVPAHLKVHLTAIELYEQKDYSSQWLKQCQELWIDTAQIAQNNINNHVIADLINGELWQKSWLIIQHHWFKQLSELQPYTLQQYQQLQSAFAQWIDAGLVYDIDLWAFLTAHTGQYQTAIDIWQHAFKQCKIVQYPLEYHWAKLQLIEDTQQRLNYLFSIANQKLIIQELLAMNLNQLHESYWQQILEYLQDEQELLPVLEQLLPAIDSQEVLDRLLNFCKLDPENDMFTRRIQRLKTLHACLYSQWDTVLERLNLYLPISDENALQQRLAKHFQNVVVRNSKKSRITAQHQYHEEVLDMLYALNLNTHFGIVQSTEQLNQYQQYDLAQQIFDLIRNIFSTPDPDPNSNHIIWKANFSAVRALTCLVEKSPNLYDPFFLYGQLVAETDSKENLYPFFLERLYVTMERIKLFQSNDEKLMEMVERMEQRLKKQLQNFNLHQLPIEPPILKQPSEIIKSILALTTQENAKIQQLEREERLAQERAEKERLEREQAILRERERVEQERLKAERLAQQQAEKERLEAERLAQQQAEKERLEAERLAQQQAEKERLEAERLAQQQAEQQRLENERLEAERIAKQQAEEQQRLEAERITQQQTEQQRLHHEQMLARSTINQSFDNFATETVNTNNSSNYFTQQAPNLNAYVPQTSTIEFIQFDLRIFLARSHRRLNIENSKTGELFSLNLTNGQVKSDWAYQQQQHIYHLPSIQLNILVFNDSIHLHYLTYGVYSQIQL